MTDRAESDGRAGIRLRSQSTESESVEVALLDLAESSCGPTPAWDDFCLDNGGDPRGPGSAFPSSTRAPRRRDDPAALEVAEAIHMRPGRRPSSAHDDLRALRCRPRTAACSFRRWSLPGFDDRGGCIGATVTLSRVIAVPPGFGGSRTCRGLPQTNGLRDPWPPCCGHRGACQARRRSTQTLGRLGGVRARRY